MTESIYVKPREGGRVRMPERNYNVMPAEGATVPRVDYYERLLIGGDISIADPPPAKPATPPESKPAEETAKTKE
ncbi:DUF2635 domain-containing protein [Rhodopseudomonas sp. BR0C11]|uniref:DUF2635 domain-containing protein n=1 Tax=Rhodopseudomonas sp. BR0C11 TaxID=2269370 RepID=UPI0013E05418|nr:DUF2635 domain-containing protein [Rhodopseudomonas sp. BR0C11]NEV79281.1 DUF2635 domain-containing protein [Rhodopseudomonas sp. BR0C11]